MPYTFAPVPQRRWRGGGLILMKISCWGGAEGGHCVYIYMITV